MRTFLMQENSRRPTCRRKRLRACRYETLQSLFVIHRGFRPGTNTTLPAKEKAFPTGKVAPRHASIVVAVPLDVLAQEMSRDEVVHIKNVSQKGRANPHPIPRLAEVHGPRVVVD